MLARQKSILFFDTFTSTCPECKSTLGSLGRLSVDLFSKIERISDVDIRFSFLNGSLDVRIKYGDLSKEPCDAIVNTTNVSMCPDGGLDSIIHQTMGQYFTDQVVAVHKDMGNNACRHGQSRIFIAKFNRQETDPRYIISTVGPLYSAEEKERGAFLLTSCYYTSLALANLYQLSSIAYPAISCGTNGYPPNDAARVAIEAIRNYSYNVKDVRFVLFDRSMYDTFVQEWTAYAAKVNEEANVAGLGTSASESSKPSKISPPTPPKPSGRYCVLCKNQELPVDRQLLCAKCSQMGRPAVFTAFLSRLRTAAEKSLSDLEKECHLLKPILKSYPLTYNPAQKFDPSIHQRDTVAEHYVQSHCDKHLRAAVPMAIVGDGNCFYNTFVKLGGVGTTTDALTLTPVELRARNIVELVLNVNVYRTQYQDIANILDNFENYVRKEMVRDSNYTSVWDLFSIPTVLNIDVLSIYPRVNGPDDLNCVYLNEKSYIPLQTGDTSENEEKKTETSNNSATVRILFSHCNRPSNLSKDSKGWTPNHFVPLLNC